MYTYNGQELTYTVEENGYTIYLGGKAWLSQHEPHIPNKELSYEENAIAQIEGIIEGEAEAKTIAELTAQVATLEEANAMQLETIESILLDVIPATIEEAVAAALADQYNDSTTTE